MGALTTEAPKDVDTKSDSMADDSNARENRDKGDYLENLKVRPTPQLIRWVLNVTPNHPGQVFVYTLFLPLFRSRYVS